MQQSPVILNLCLSKARSEEHYNYRDVIVRKASFPKCFPSTLKRMRKAGVFKFLRRSVDGVVTRMNSLKSGWTHCVHYTTHQIIIGFKYILNLT